MVSHTPNKGKFECERTLLCQKGGKTMRIRYSALPLLAVLLTGPQACVLNSGVISAGNLPVGQNGNRQPILQALSANPSSQSVGGQPITFTVLTHDPDGDQLQLTWTATGGILSATAGQTVSWRPPPTPGTYSVMVTVSDGRGGATTAAQNIIVAGDTARLQPPTGVSPGPTPQPEQRPTASDSPTAAPSAIAAPSGATGAGRWIVQPSGVSSALRALWFFDRQDGFVVGDEGVVLKTEDAGATWKRISSDAIAADDLTDVAFIDAQTGWMTSTTGRIFRTDDGGLNWKIAHKADAPLGGISFATSTVGYAVGGEPYLGAAAVLKTVDGGASWSPLHTGAPAGLSFIVNGGDNVWIGGSSGIDRHVPELGWEPVIREQRIRGLSIPSTREAWYYRFDPDAGYADQYLLFRTSTGGSSWERVQLKDARGDRFTLTEIHGLDFSDPRSGWVLGRAPNELSEDMYQPTLFSTADGGVTWSMEPVKVEMGRGIHAFEMVDSTGGWAIGDSGGIYRYVAIAASE